MRMLQAANGRAAAVPFQMPMFGRYGSKSFAVLERLRYAARHIGVFSIVGRVHGGHSNTLSAIAVAYFGPGAQMKADAITLLLCCGERLLRGLVEDALNNGICVFIASLTSGEDRRSVQSAIRQSGSCKSQTVVCGIAAAAQKHNALFEGWGPLV